jgi:starch-binding outer membrane protein, SusD/RagB family
MKKIINGLMFISCAVSLFSCKKDFLDTRPQGRFLEQDVRELGEASASSLIKVVDPTMKGIYTYMYSYNTSSRASGRHDDFGQKSIDLSTDMMTEDIVQVVHHWFGFDYLLDDREAAFARTFTNWNFYYRIVSISNKIASQIDPTVTDAPLKAVRGQALAMRAYCYLNLVQLYQQTYKGNETAPGVPLYADALSDGRPRAPMQEVYDQIEDDLLEAIGLLAGFTRISKEQINQNVARGILARAYLNMERWADAASQANLAKAGFAPMSAAQYNAGFNDINNPEWMWGGDITSTTSSFVASFFGLMDNTSTSTYNGALGVYRLIDKKLFDQIPLTDERRKAFRAPTDPPPASNANMPVYASSKFRDIFPGNDGDYLYMRGAEMYLIEAEALARNNNNSGAAQVLFSLVSTRNPAYTLSTNTGQALIDEIILQRRIELWAEGFSLNDYKRWKRGINRTGSNHRADAQLVIPAGDKRFFLQIPQREFETNPAFTAADQNP